MKPPPRRDSSRRWFRAPVVLAALAALGAGDVAAVAAQAPASLHGTIIDSVRGSVLSKAIVQLEPVRREALTTAFGAYRFDSVPAGTYRLRVLHPMLDTAGIALVTPSFEIAEGQSRLMDIAVPSGLRLLQAFCTQAQLLRGPGALVGFVRDPDSDRPVDSAVVSLVYEKSDPTGLMKDTVTRTATPDSVGRYRICGLPTGMSGRVQVIRNGVTSGDVPVTMAEGPLVLRGLGLSTTTRVVSVQADSGGRLRVLTGDARATGRVLDRSGRPVEGARVSVLGTLSAAITRANGQFALDSLPSGTQTLEVRKVGFSITEQAVDLTSMAPADVTVTMTDAVPMLDAVRTVAQRDKDLADIGFIDRRRSGNGYYREGGEINRNSLTFSDAMRGVPGLNVQPLSGTSRRGLITSSRDPNGCVSFVIDGFPWKSMEPGDVDDYLKPGEVQAIEVYSSSTVPIQFARTQDGRCMTVVVWTTRRIRDR